MFTAVVEGAEELAHDWVNVRAAVRAGMRRGVSMGVKEGAADARALHRYKNQTGKLEASTVGTVTGSSETEHRGEIAATEPYASFVEKGTAAHVILPKKRANGNRGLLHWEAPQGDHHFARKVNHPGTTALPFLGIAYLKCERVMIREIEIGIANAQIILSR